MERANRSRGWMALGFVFVLIMGAVALPSVSAARTRTVLNLGPLTLQEASQVESVVSITNLTDGSRQVEVKFFDETGAVVGQQRLTIGPGDSGQATHGYACDSEGGSSGSPIPRCAVRARVTSSGSWLASAPISMQGINSSAGSVPLVTEIAFPALFSGEDLWTVSATSPIVHVVPEHALRIAVTNLGKSPTTFSGGLIGTTYGGDGPTDVMPISNLGPGVTGWATFPSSATATDVRPAVTGPKGSRALVTAELFDEATGETLGIWFCDWVDY